MPHIFQAISGGAASGMDATVPVAAVVAQQ